MQNVLLPFYKPGKIEAGCDEAGRGCLAGPVYAAAVILSEDFYHPLLNDSKKINEKNRYLLRNYIQENALAYAVGSVDNELIDKINILNASFLAMHIAIEQLSIKPNLLLIDGNRFNKYKKIPHKCIVKGDSLYQSIAAASILAKTYRDDFMKNIHKSYPVYGWNKNKGYPTLLHRTKLAEYGLTPFHRKSFSHMGDQLEIDFNTPA
jgi:ribonuclease HII